jgi:hypothetical protein
MGETMNGYFGFRCESSFLVAQKPPLVIAKQAENRQRIDSVMHILPFCHPL